MTDQAVLVERADPSELDELRRLVLRPELPVGASFRPLDRPDAVHLAARDAAGTILGTAVVAPEPYPLRPGVAAWQLRGMAVAPGAQGGGVGAAVLAAAVEVVRDGGGAVLWCNARDTAIGFYERFGFVVQGPGFLSTTGLPHHEMWLGLS